MITFPPNGYSLFIICCKLMSSVSMAQRFAIGASSQMISRAFHSKYAVPLCFHMLHMVVSFAMIGILKRECAIHSLGIIVAPTPDIIAVRAILFFDRRCASNARYKYIFPVLPKLSMKKTTLVSFWTLSSMISVLKGRLGGVRAPRLVLKRVSSCLDELGGFRGCLGGLGGV